MCNLNTNTIMVYMGGKHLYMKSVLFVILSVFILSGCGTDQGAIGTMDEPSRDENQEAGPRDNYEGGVNDNGEETPMDDAENSIIGDDQSDLMDTDTNGNGNGNGTGTTENGNGTGGTGTEIRDNGTETSK